jgi:calcineurin-like phosphoesterase family protein
MIEPVARYWTADLHLGHTNIIRYCGRPFADVDEMDEALIAHWNETVGPDDEVWVLGDLAMGPIDRGLERASRLQGRKVLVAGNHDRCWYGHGDKAERWIDRYLSDAGFVEIVQGSVDAIVAGVPVHVCHFPYEGDSHDADRYTAHRPADDGGWLLHGHVHERWRTEGRQVNVGVDVWDFRPVSDAELAPLLTSASPGR